MKKSLALASLAILATATVAIAAPATVNSGAVTAAAAAVIRGGATETAADAASPMGKMSTGVKLGTSYSTAGFTIMTKHLKGSKVFGTAHDSTAIFWQLLAADTDISATQVGTTIGTGAFATNWTAM